MFLTHIRLALSNIRRARVRSTLTMLGVIIGVMSVVSTVSLGQGLKDQVIKQLNFNGANAVSIRPGQTLKKDENGNKIGINWSSMFGAINSLTVKDVETLSKSDIINSVAPIGVISGDLKNEDKIITGGTIIATNGDLDNIMNLRMDRGDFFDNTETDKAIAILSRPVAEALFGQPYPIGQVVNIRGTDFIIRGIVSDLPVNPLNFGVDYSSAVFIPFKTGEKISENQVQIREIIVGVQDINDPKSIQTITDQLLVNHKNQNDFSVLKQEDYLLIAETIFDILTGFVSAIAGISLFVGGIGIMNIMLVNVSERTREIGIRKAIGATNRQILDQFLIESVVISGLGGITGIIISVLGSASIRIFTDLRPTIDPLILTLAGVLSIVVGVVFGVAPAIGAARKDPITSLRHE